MTTSSSATYRWARGRNWRPDAKRFPTSAVGKPINHWPGERWLDLRDATVHEAIVARLDLAVANGCDGMCEMDSRTLLAEEWMTPEDATRIDAAMDIVYRQELLRRLQAVLPDPKEAGRIEPDLGLSRGYLSRLRKSTRTPNEALLAILALFRQHPATLKQVEAFWQQPVQSSWPGVTATASAIGRGPPILDLFGGDDAPRSVDSLDDRRRVELDYG